MPARGLWDISEIIPLYSNFDTVAVVRRMFMYLITCFIYTSNNRTMVTARGTCSVYAIIGRVHRYDII